MTRVRSRRMTPPVPPERYGVVATIAARHRSCFTDRGTPQFARANKRQTEFARANASTPRAPPRPTTSQRRARARPDRRDPEKPVDQPKPCFATRSCRRWWRRCAAAHRRRRGARAASLRAPVAAARGDGPACAPSRRPRTKPVASARWSWSTTIGGRDRHGHPSTSRRRYRDSSTRRPRQIATAPLVRFRKSRPRSGIDARVVFREQQRVSSDERCSETRALSALSADGFDIPAIHRLYPYLSTPQIQQALELEQQLANNLGKRAA